MTFQVLLSTIFYKKSGTFNEIFLIWSSLTCNTFLKKSWFLCSDKSHIAKKWWSHHLLLLHYQKANKISKPGRLITHLQDMCSITGTFEDFSSNFQNTFFAEHISAVSSWNYIIVSMLSFRGCPRLWNTFEFAFFTLDTNSAVKINYDVLIHSATKFKKHKVQSWVNTDTFKQHFR